MPLSVLYHQPQLHSKDVHEVYEVHEVLLLSQLLLLSQHQLDLSQIQNVRREGKPRSILVDLLHIHLLGSDCFGILFDAAETTTTGLSKKQNIETHLLFPKENTEDYLESV